MITKLIAVQKVSVSGKVEVFQIESESAHMSLQWTFETRRKQAHDEAYFPFIVNGKKNVWLRKAGAETRTTAGLNQLTFCDDYSVPEGSVICILLPKGFVPDIMKFKETPYMPIGLSGLVATRPPGYIQTYFNYDERQSAIVFQIAENTAFGFKCITQKVSDSDFPKHERSNANDSFTISISRDLLGVEAIRNEDLALINQTLEKQYDLSELRDAMNQLLVAAQGHDKQATENALSKVGALLNVMIGATSGLATLADSYTGGNSVYHFIHKIFSYLAL